MRRRRRRKKKIPRRFPRLDVPQELNHYMRIIRTTYNMLATRKDPQKRRFGYDIYKTKLAGRASIAFLDLARQLKDYNIDPSLYLKIMSRYGRFKNATYMPRPTVLAKKSWIENFKWVYRREKKHYDLKLDFKREISGWSVFDVYASIRDSASMLKDAIEKVGLHPDQAIVMLKKDLSPWFMATSLLVADDRKDFLLCLDLLRKDRRLKKLAIKAYKKSL